jgi:hypothetical protein
MTTDNEILQLIRSAAGHEDTAGRHEDKHEQQMKSAGASMYAAFALALKAAPEYQGRKIDEKAIQRIYQSTKPRPWWDAHLLAAKLTVGVKADRERAARLIQWHLDPVAASARRAQRALQDAARRKKLDKQRSVATHGPRTARKAATVERREAAHAARITEAAHEAVAGGRAPGAAQENAAEEVLGIDDLLREVNRIGVAAKRVAPKQRGAVRETLVVTAREIERYV